jgi:GH18 family chitinase
LICSATAHITTIATISTIDEEKEAIIATLDPRPPPEEQSTNPPLNSTLQPSIPFQIPPGQSKNISTDIGLGWFRDNKATTKGCKIMVALGGWTWSNNFAEVAKDAEKREVFGQSVKEFLEEWGLDGIGTSLIWDGAIGYRRFQLMRTT